MSNEKETPETNAVPTPVAPAAGQTLDSQAITTLLQIMLSREARLAREEEAKQKAIDQRQVQRNRNAASHSEDAQAIQTKCKHLKGGRSRLRTQIDDFAVYMHTFINGERVIKCQLCGAKWKANDTVEFLFRYGKKVANHTAIGWKEALQMLAKSSNKPSSSEIPMIAQPLAQAAGTNLIEN
jgi:hypothetical protein